jgi:hypothetical protein
MMTLYTLYTSYSTYVTLSYTTPYRIGKFGNELIGRVSMEIRGKKLEKSLQDYVKGG